MRCVLDSITRTIQEIDKIGFDKEFTFNGPFTSNKSEWTEKLQADDIVIHTLINWQNIKK